MLYGSDRAVREAVFDGSALQWTAGFPASIQPGNVGANGVMLANLEVDATGRLFTNDYSYDLRVFAASGALEHQWLEIADQALIAGPAASMRISGDGLRLIGNGRLMGIAP